MPDCHWHDVWCLYNKFFVWHLLRIEILEDYHVSPSVGKQLLTLPKPNALALLPLGLCHWPVMIVCCVCFCVCHGLCTCIYLPLISGHACFSRGAMVTMTLMMVGCSKQSVPWISCWFCVCTCCQWDVCPSVCGLAWFCLPVGKQLFLENFRWSQSWDLWCITLTDWDLWCITLTDPSHMTHVTLHDTCFLLINE